MIDRDKVKVSGIVLAGGRSSRFGADKLAVMVDGRPLLDAAIAGIAAVATDIIVVLAPGDGRVLPGGLSVRAIADPESFGGPLVGLLAGLEAVAEPFVVVAAGDMPRLNAAVLDLMVRTLATADDAFGAVILERRGRRQPLPAVVRTGSATDFTRQLVADGERSLRSLFERLPTRTLEEGEWRPLDPDGDTLRDIDRPSDLDSRYTSNAPAGGPTRSRAGGSPEGSGGQPRNG